MTGTADGRGGADAAGPVVILGRGRVGRSLADAWAAAGITVELRSARDDASFAAGFADDALVVVAVPDGAIAAVAERVVDALQGGRPIVEATEGAATDGVAARRSGPSGAEGPASPGGLAGPERQGGPAVVHLSGASGFGPLEPLRAAGLAVGIAHPFYPFPEVRSPAVLRGATFGIGASGDALAERLGVLVAAIGGVPCAVTADGWVAYHAAGTVASNFPIVLAAQAVALLERAGLDRGAATAALLPLMQGALDNLAAEGVDHALSGPLRRGDAGTVERHLGWLDDHEPSIAAVYRALTVPGIELARGTGLDGAAADALRRVVG